jgi:hypothetical protein
LHLWSEITEKLFENYTVIEMKKIEVCISVSVAGKKG